jgi:hypothetical protein
MTSLDAHEATRSPPRAGFLVFGGWVLFLLSLSNAFAALDESWNVDVWLGQHVRLDSNYLASIILSASISGDRQSATKAPTTKNR